MNDEVPPAFVDLPEAGAMRLPETRSAAVPGLRPPVRLAEPHLRTLYEGRDCHTATNRQ